MVHLATDVASQRQLACKVIDLRKFSFNSNKLNTEEAREAIDSRTKLIREIEFLRKLNHVRNTNRIAEHDAYC
jgi:translation initiation factor IF-3